MKIIKLTVYFLCTCNEVNECTQTLCLAHCTSVIILQCIIMHCFAKHCMKSLQCPTTCLMGSNVFDFTKRATKRASRLRWIQLQSDNAVIHMKKQKWVFFFISNCTILILCMLSMYTDTLIWNEGLDWMHLFNTAFVWLKNVVSVNNIPLSLMNCHARCIYNSIVSCR